VNFATINPRVASQRVFIVDFVVLVAYFVIDSVRKLLNTPSYVAAPVSTETIIKPYKTVKNKRNKDSRKIRI
jgi:hypothetical protein